MQSSLRLMVAAWPAESCIGGIGSVRLHVADARECAMSKLLPRRPLPTSSLDRHWKNVAKTTRAASVHRHYQDFVRPRCYLTSFNETGERPRWPSRDFG